MSVYFIQAGEQGPVKNGLATDVERRCADLQTAHYQRLRVLRTLAGGHLVERWLHQRFKLLKIRGEWFRFSLEMIEICPPALASPAPRPKRACREKGAIDLIIEAAGGLKVVAEKTGLKDGVRKWPEIGIPDRYWAILIELLPGLTAEELYAANLVVRKPAVATEAGEAA